MALLKFWDFHNHLRSLLILLVVVKASGGWFSFNFTRFDQNLGEIFLERDASIIDGDISLTLTGIDQGLRASFGRATYARPLHLWDRASGNLTNFTTHFSFVINSLGSDAYGDGIAFFLAPNGSRIPPDVRDGSGLGLINNDTEATITEGHHFVAVEIDTYRNWWDPARNHVGIDISSMKSVANGSWQGGIKEGNSTDVWITYDSKQKFLSIKYTNIDDNSQLFWRNVSATVDLASYLPEWITFGFSGSTGYSYEVNKIHSWYFSSASDIVETNSVPQTKSYPGTPEDRSLLTKLVIGLSVTFIFIVGIGITSIVIKGRRKKNCMKSDDPIFDLSFGYDFKNGTGPRQFSYQELASATSNFSEGEKLGEGGSGAVYRGFLKDSNCYVAVKWVSRRHKQGVKEFVSEVKVISRLRHRNLVKLIGWCHKKDLLLAYEFLPNGSLDSHLFNGESTLSWTQRFKIAGDLALALQYLHEEGDQCVLHRDIKPSNIMLDSDFNAKLGDFGLARLVDHAKGWQTTFMAGTMGYMAPECFKSCKATKKSDIYSFGIVSLEIACGKRVLESWTEENQTTLVEWVWELYGIGKVLEAADIKLCRDFDAQQIERLMIVGLWCVQPDHNFRPNIKQVINVLSNSEAPLPEISPVMPVPAYLAPPSKPSSFYYLSSCGSSSSIGMQLH